MTSPECDRVTVPEAPSAPVAVADTSAPAEAADPPGGTGPRGGARRVLLGATSDPSWARPALLCLLAATLVLYLWNLSTNGWGNEFYTAAVQAGSRSWKAFFFGSSDAGNSITVDKPPASLWPQALSVRLFGLSSWSVLVPQALMGVAAVGALYATVKRWFGAGAGLLAGALLALTPVAALMFRFNNPDALLVLLMTVAAYTALRAVEDDRLRWFLLTGVAVGFGFLTKQLQVLLVVPGFALALLVAGRGSFRRRIRGLLIAGLAMVVSAGWWVATVELWPTGSRPWIGGSASNSFLDLTFGYNGLGRITGNEAPGGGGGGPGGMFSADRGPLRLFDGVLGTQASWLIPAALVGLVVGIWLCGRRPRTDLQRASLVVWGSWLVVTGIVFSSMSGVFHEYYTVALAPAIAALVAIGATMLWQRRTHWAAMAAAAVGIGLSTWWARELLGRAVDWNPWLVTLVTALGGVAVVGLVVLAVLDATGRPVPAGSAVAVAGVAIAALLVGPIAWTAQTVSGSHTGSIVTAGPAVSGSRGGFPGGGLPGGGFPGGGFPGGGLPGGGLPGGGLPGGGLPGGGFPGGGIPGGDTGPGPSGGGGAGPGASAAPSEQVRQLLTKDASRYRWVAATTSAMAAAPYQLATQEPVMPIGGFTGSDPSPTLSQFQRYVADREIHWFIAGGGPGGGVGGPFPGGELPGGGRLPGGAGQGPGGAGGSQAISRWVGQHFTPVTVDGVTMYDLTSPTTTG